MQKKVTKKENLIFLQNVNILQNEHVTSCVKACGAFLLGVKLFFAPKSREGCPLQPVVSRFMRKMVCSL